VNLHIAIGNVIKKFQLSVADHYRLP